MKHLDLFSGIGGFALAASRVWPNHEVVAFCEIDKFCQKVLKKHWPGVPIYDDIKILKGSDFGRIDILTGGFPCQPYSVAGKRRGKEDDRALWPEMLRVISEVHPTWIVGENVSGFIHMGLDDCIADLEGEGYEVQSFIIPACAVGAPHRRDRVWIVAHAGRTNGKARISYRMGDDKGAWSHQEAALSNKQDAANTSNQGLQSPERPGPRGQRPASHGPATQCHNPWDEPWIEAASRLCRVDDGLPRRMDRTARLKALGNAIVPQVAEQIFKAIKEVD